MEISDSDNTSQRTKNSIWGSDHSNKELYNLSLTVWRFQLVLDANTPEVPPRVRSHIQHLLARNYLPEPLPPDSTTGPQKDITPELVRNAQSQVLTQTY